MSRRGRALAATPAQVTQVRSLAAEGLSERKIAEIVFGDARYRGRVERLVRPGSSPPAHDSLEGTLLKADEATQSSEPELPSIRELLNRPQLGARGLTSKSVGGFRSAGARKETQVSSERNGSSTGPSFSTRQSPSSARSTMSPFT